MKKEKTTISLSVTNSQHELLEKKAGMMGLEIDAYLLFCALNARIDIRVGADPAIVHLEKLLEMIQGGYITEDEYEKVKRKIFEDDATREMMELEKRENLPKTESR